MKVYSVGENCIHEGAGWSLLVADNENSIENIKNVIIDNYLDDIAMYYDCWTEDNEDSEYWKGKVLKLKDSIEYISGCNDVESMQGYQSERGSYAVDIRLMEVIK